MATECHSFRLHSWHGWRWMLFALLLLSVVTSSNARAQVCLQGHWENFEPMPFPGSSLFYADDMLWSHHLDVESGSTVLDRYVDGQWVMCGILGGGRITFRFEYQGSVWLKGTFVTFNGESANQVVRLDGESGLRTILTAQTENNIATARTIAITGDNGYLYTLMDDLPNVVVYRLSGDTWIAIPPTPNANTYAYLGGSFWAYGDLMTFSSTSWIGGGQYRTFYNNWNGGTQVWDTVAANQAGRPPDFTYGFRYVRIRNYVSTPPAPGAPPFGYSSVSVSGLTTGGATFWDHCTQGYSSGGVTGGKLGDRIYVGRTNGQGFFPPSGGGCTTNRGMMWMNVITLDYQTLNFPTGPSTVVGPANGGVLYIGQPVSTGAVPLHLVWKDGCAPCDSIDFNLDTLFPDTQDIADFLGVFAGGVCAGQVPTDPPCNTDIDFNNDGLFPDTQDIASLLSLFSGGPCP